MKTTNISTGYSPRPLQAKIHREIYGKRFSVLVCHRRFGKTVFAINEMIDRALSCKLKNPQYAYIAPTYGQAKRVVWQYLKDYTHQLPGYTINEQELRVDITAPHGNGRIRFMLLGAENPDTIRGIYLDGCINDEYADFHPDVWSKVVRPALSDRLGWAVFIGTPKGHNDFKDKYDLASKSPNWYTAVYKASDTKILPQSELDDAKIEMGEEAYMQEYECSWTAALSGSYYAKYLDELRVAGKIGNVPYDPALTVNTYWDLGISDTTTIWFRQQFGNEYRYIDYYEMSGVGLEHYVKTLKEKPYVYERHILPHDAEARSLDTGKTRVETLRSLGIRVEVQNKQAIPDRINAGRVILPRCRFDSVKCAKGIDALLNYQRKWDSKNKIYSDTPLHNWASHGADSFGYSALDSRDQNKLNNRDMPRTAIQDYNELDY